MRYLITAALPYANGPLHIGHVAGAYLPADIFARFLRLQGHEVLFLCGSDEHGVAITLRAWQEGTTPQAIIDRYHPLIEQSLSALSIHFDYYGRTSDTLHHQTAQGFFRRLHEKKSFREAHSRAVLGPAGAAVSARPVHRRYLSALRLYRGIWRPV